MDIRAIGSLELRQAQGPLPVRKLVNRSHTFSFMREPLETTFGYRHRPLFNRSHRRPAGKFFIHSLVNEQQLGPESVPKYGKHDHACADKNITLTHGNLPRICSGFVLPRLGLEKAGLLEKSDS